MENRELASCNIFSLSIENNFHPCQNSRKCPGITHYIYSRRTASCFFIFPVPGLPFLQPFNGCRQSFIHCLCCFCLRYPFYIFTSLGWGKGFKYSQCFFTFLQCSCQWFWQGQFFFWWRFRPGQFYFILI